MDGEQQVLTQQEAAILDMEINWWRLNGSKESAIKETMGISPARYYQILQQLIHTDAAERHSPVLVRRMRKQAEARELHFARCGLGLGPNLVA